MVDINPVIKEFLNDFVNDESFFFILFIDVFIKLTEIASSEYIKSVRPPKSRVIFICFTLKLYFEGRNFRIYVMSLLGGVL